jgi:hypothetical protein
VTNQDARLALSSFGNRHLVCISDHLRIDALFSVVHDIVVIEINCWIDIKLEDNRVLCLRLSGQIIIQRGQLCANQVSRQDGIECLVAVVAAVPSKFKRLGTIKAHCMHVVGVTRVTHETTV